MWFAQGEKLFKTIRVKLFDFECDYFNYVISNTLEKVYQAVIQIYKCVQSILNTKSLVHFPSKEL